MTTAKAVLIVCALLSGCGANTHVEADCSAMKGVWSQMGSDLRIEIRKSVAGTSTDFWGVKFLGHFVRDEAGNAHAVTAPGKLPFLATACVQDGEDAKLESPRGFKIWFGPTGNLSFILSEGARMPLDYATSGYQQVGD